MASKLTCAMRNGTVGAVRTLALVVQPVVTEDGRCPLCGKIFPVVADDRLHAVRCVTYAAVGEEAVAAGVGVYILQRDVEVGCHLILQQQVNLIFFWIFVCWGCELRIAPRKEVETLPLQTRYGLYAHARQTLTAPEVYVCEVGGEVWSHLVLRYCCGSHK